MQTRTSREKRGRSMLIDGRVEKKTAEGCHRSTVYLTVDGGTTNTRVHLVRDGAVVESFRASIGAGQGDPEALAAAVREGIHRLLDGWGLTESDVTRIIASGMITSEKGLCPLPHLEAPVGIAELHDAMYETALPHISSIPFVFVRGVKVHCDDPLRADMMRGEETELMGLIRQGPAQVILPGSHSKSVTVDEQGRIVEFYTSLTGEMLAALSAHTILRTSVHMESAGLCTDALLQGFDCCDRMGLNRSLFKVRTRDTLFGRSDDEIYSFFLGCVLCEELKGLRLCADLPVTVGGRSRLRDAICLLLKERFSIVPERVSDEAVDASVALGAVRIFEYGKE